MFVPVELIALIRKPESPGLSALLESESESALRAKDVRSHSMGLDLERDSRGRLQPSDLIMRVTAPDFEPKVQEKTVRVYPDRDCEQQTFLLTPQQTGDLRVQFDVLQEGRAVASRLLKAQSDTSDRLPPGEQRRVVVTVPLDVKVDPPKSRFIVVDGRCRGDADCGGRGLVVSDASGRWRDTRGKARRQRGSRPYSVPQAGPHGARGRGISSYPPASGFRALNYADNDADAAATELKRGGYQTQLLKNDDAYKSKIEEWSTHSAVRPADPEGTVIFYFAGHGVQIDQEQYLLPYNASDGDIEKSGLSLSELEEKLRAIQAPRKIVFLDACRNQGLKDAKASRMAVR